MNMLQNDTHQKLIDLKTLCDILLIKGVKGAVKWCNDVNIEILVVANKRVVHKFLVDIELDKRLIAGLKKKYPDSWQELYHCYMHNDKAAYLILIDTAEYIDNRPIATRVKPLSKIAIDFANS